MIITFVVNYFSKLNFRVFSTRYMLPTVKSWNGKLFPTIGHESDECGVHFLWIKFREKIWVGSILPTNRKRIKWKPSHLESLLPHWDMFLVFLEINTMVIKVNLILWFTELTWIHSEWRPDNMTHVTCNTVAFIFIWPASESLVDKWRRTRSYV